MYKSASALAALIRVSLTLQRKEIFVIVSRIEPVFHLETLAGSRTCSEPENKWFLLLVRLARETLVTVKRPPFDETFDLVLGTVVSQLWPTPETALHLRRRFIRALKVYRCALDSLSVLDKPG